MFTGIISDIGTIELAQSRDDGLEITVRTAYDDLELGESVAANGACLTVEKFDGERAVFWLSKETLARCADLKQGMRVNLERALRVGDRLSGHFVQGHVDAKGRVFSITQQGGAYVVRFFLPESLRPFLVEKGAISVNGISLTVNEIGENGVFNGIAGFAVGLTIIPHTWTHTALSDLSVGDCVNIETDMMAKHLVELSRLQLKTGTTLHADASMGTILAPR